MEEAKLENKSREDAVAGKNREIQSLKNELGAVVGQLKSAETSARQAKTKLETAEVEVSRGSQATELVN